MENIDIIVFISYCLVILSIGLYVSRDKKGLGKSAEDYFLAGKSLPWWTIGASLIAANISAEQFIGMSGSGFALGLAIATYEWMAAVTLLVVGKFFLPIFIEKKIYTIPEFVKKRYSNNLKTILAVFWICLFIFVNLTTVMYLGGKAMDTIFGTGDGSLITVSIIGLGLFALTYSIWGGLSAVAWTDVVQVVILILGGMLMTGIALGYVMPEHRIDGNGGILDGLSYVYSAVPERFSMILSEGEIITPDGRDAYIDLPGIAVLIGGMWIANTYYWGFNQYIIQRTLAAKSLSEAQKGIAFAAFLKLIIPIFVVLPGIIAYVINLDPETGQLLKVLPEGFTSQEGNILNDNAAPWLIKNYIPVGIKGLILAALAAAIVSSLASMLNSTSTIFTMDIYKEIVNKNAKDKELVNVGRIVVFFALIISMYIAPKFGNLGQVFQAIQEYTGVVSPGILAVFIMGLYYKKATNNAAIWGILFSIPVAMYFKVVAKGWLTIFPEFTHTFFIEEIPFLHQMGITFIITLLFIYIISYLDGNNDDPKGIELRKKLFYTSPSFNIPAFAVLLITAMLYAIFW